MKYIVIFYVRGEIEFEMYPDRETAQQAFDNPEAPQEPMHLCEVIQSKELEGYE